MFQKWSPSLSMSSFNTLFNIPQGTNDPQLTYFLDLNTVCFSPLIKSQSRGFQTFTNKSENLQDCFSSRNNLYKLTTRHNYKRDKQLKGACQQMFIHYR